MTIWPEVDAFALVRGSAGLVEHTVHRVPGPEMSEIRLVSPEALQLVQRLAWVATPGWIERITPDGWEAVRIAGAPAGHWLAMALVALLSLGVTRRATLAVVWLLARTWRGLDRPHATQLARVVLLPLGVLLACTIFALATAFLGISVVARVHVAPLVEIVSWLALAWLVWRALDCLAAVGLGSLSRKRRLGAISVVTLLRRAGKVLIVAAAAIAAFNSLGGHHGLGCRARQRQPRTCRSAQKRRPNTSSARQTLRSGCPAGMRSSRST